MLWLFLVAIVFVCAGALAWSNSGKARGNHRKLADTLGLRVTRPPWGFDRTAYFEVFAEGLIDGRRAVLHSHSGQSGRTTNLRIEADLADGGPVVRRWFLDFSRAAPDFFGTEMSSKLREEFILQAKMADFWWRTPSITIEGNFVELEIGGFLSNDAIVRFFRESAPLLVDLAGQAESFTRRPIRPDDI